MRSAVHPLLFGLAVGLIKGATGQRRKHNYHKTYENYPSMISQSFSSQLQAPLQADWLQVHLLLWRPRQLPGGLPAMPGHWCQALGAHQHGREPAGQDVTARVRSLLDRHRGQGGRGQVYMWYLLLLLIKSNFFLCLQVPIHYHDQQSHLLQLEGGISTER